MGLARADPGPLNVAGEELGGIISVGTGGSHTCALIAGGTAQCWGARIDRLNGGSELNRRNPTPVSGLSGAVALATGGDTGCVLMPGGIPQCWGNNRFGQLGDGTTTDRSTPTPVLGLTGATALTTGDASHTCALMPGGTAQCWGDNRSGQLGDGHSGPLDGGADINRSSPAPVLGLTGATALTAGGAHTCALMPGGTAQCWGRNNFGQLGDGVELGDGTIASRSTSAPVLGLTGATALTAGGAHTCALMPGGTAQCWGYNRNGQLGDGTTTDRSIPTPVLGLTGATALTAGGTHTCALMPGGTAQCWGNNNFGQLGDGHSSPPGSGTDINRSTPAPVLGLTGATALTAGFEHNCALSSRGTAACWGNNSSGELGDGTTIIRSTPTPVVIRTAEEHMSENIPPGQPANSNWWDWPDIDDDGIPDFWETNGVEVEGKGRLDLAEAGATVGTRDLFVFSAYEDNAEFSSIALDIVKKSFADSPLKISLHIIRSTQPLMPEIASNVAWAWRDGKDRVRDIPNFAQAKEHSGFLDWGWSGSRTVPQLAKFFVNLHPRPDDDKGGNTIGIADVGGFNGWTAYRPQTQHPDALGSHPSPTAVYRSLASNLMHEIGHTLGLRHYGALECQPPSSGNSCFAGSPHYKSVMSYAYNVTGVDGKYVDYSRISRPNLDWRAARASDHTASNPQAYGAIRLVPGQNGESTHEAGVMTYIEENLSDMAAQIPPSAFDEFAKEYGVEGRPDFPQFVDPQTTVAVTGTRVAGELRGRDNANSALSLTITQQPEHGTFTTDGMSYLYTPEPGFTGQDAVTVRTASDRFSSEPLTVLFTVSATPPSTTTAPSTPPNPGTGSLGGLFGS
uniref:Ig-like domain-containing protein n=2 Tax=Actinomycetes TaxID=1760 RepID=UPI001C4DFA54|nr:Ig-like domain-containing protein [Rhodococcus qingshengii]